jgi:hypothetical protein
MPPSAPLWRLPFPEEHQTSPINGVRYFDRNEFAATTECDVKLLKLHGSINWRVLSNDDTGIFAAPGAECRNRDGGPIDLRQRHPRFLTGGPNKLLNYQAGIFLAQLAEFDRALEGHDSLLMSGYGWGDQGISRRLKDWAFAKAGRRILLLHADPDSLRAARPLQHSFDRLIEKGSLIVIEKWMKDVAIDEGWRALSDNTAPPS